MRVGPTRRGLLAGIAASAALAGAPASAQARRALTIGLPTTPPQLEPVLLSTTPLYRVVFSCFDSLLRVNDRADGRLEPGLATAWEVTSPTQVDLRLREGVRFHDGAVMTAEDVVFSLGPTRLLGPGGRGATSAPDFLGTLERVEATGPMTVRVVTKQSDPLILQRLAAWTSQIMSKRAFDAMGGWERWAMAPVGTGPYRIAEVQADTRVRIVAHDAYWGGRPPFTAIDFRDLPEPSTRLNALLTGDIDIAVDILPDQLPALARNEMVEVMGGEIGSIRTVNYDTRGPVTRELNIRRALSLAVDRAAIIASLWDGRVSVPRGFQLPGFRELFIADRPQPRFDPAEARRLVRSSSYDGRPIEYRILNNYYTNELTTAQALVEMWRDVGLNVHTRMVPGISQLYAAPIEGLFNNSTTMQLPDPVGMTWRSWGAESIFQRRVPLWAPEEYNRLGGILISSSDVEERRRAHRRMLEIMDDEDSPCVVLHTNAVLYGMRRGTSWRPSSNLQMDFGPFNA